VPRGWILAPAFAGKSTSHRAGQLIDPEETQAFAPIRKAWAALGWQPSPRQKITLHTAYNEAAVQAVMGNDEIVATHPMDSASVLLFAGASGREAVVVAPSDDVIAARARTYAAANDAGLAAQRIGAAISGLQRAREVAITLGLKRFDTVGEAVRYLKGDRIEQEEQADALAAAADLD